MKAFWQNHDCGTTGTGNVTQTFEDYKFMPHGFHHVSVAIIFACLPPLTTILPPNELVLVKGSAGRCCGRKKGRYSPTSKDRKVCAIVHGTLNRDSDEARGKAYEGAETWTGERR